MQMETRIIRSAKRVRTVSARIVKDTLVVRAPYLLSESRLQRIVADFKERFQRQKAVRELNSARELSEIASKLNARYFSNELKINAIVYADNQRRRFGCCNYHTGCIRISRRVSTMPRWVREYVVLHELAHLQVPNHSTAFRDIVSRFRLAERARGYLMAVSRESP